MGGRTRFVIAALGGPLLLGLPAWLFLTRGPLAPLEVTTVAVARGEPEPRVFGIGTVEARRSDLIGPTLPSRVTRVLAAAKRDHARLAADQAAVGRQRSQYRGGPITAREAEPGSTVVARSAAGSGSRPTPRPGWRRSWWPS